MQSAALGLAVSGALALGYSNIFVSAPSPENLRTLFEFVLRGLEELGYKVKGVGVTPGSAAHHVSPLPLSSPPCCPSLPPFPPQEHIDYDLVESTNPAWARAPVRINVYRSHRQTVAYVQPQHHAALVQAELLVIDEVSVGGGWKGRTRCRGWVPASAAAGGAAALAVGAVRARWQGRRPSQQAQGLSRGASSHAQVAATHARAPSPPLHTRAPPPPRPQAAAIPLPLVRAMLGPYLVFLCSTVNGYEGTGRSLSLKLLQQLRQQVGAWVVWVNVKV